MAFPLELIKGESSQRSNLLTILPLTKKTCETAFWKSQMLSEANSKGVSAQLAMQYCESMLFHAMLTFF